MAALNSLYRAAKKVMNGLPAWLVRFRPFGVYEIRLQPTGNTPAPSQLLRDSRRARFPCQIRWVNDQSEVPMLRRVASATTCADLNFTTRRVVAAWFEGQVIGCAWIATESFEEVDLGLRFELHPADAWLFAAVVDEARRNQGVYGQMLGFLIAELGSGNARRILLGVTVGNEPSRNAHARRGATQVGRILAVRILGFTLCRSRGQVRQLSPLPISFRMSIQLAVSV
jgi:GNAT superfamily N-acetyltransferase